MQVSEKAARDVGGGDRFDVVQNRAIGRAYLALLYRRYGNWPDAISAYNWGLGNVDIWIRGGRPAQELVPAIAVYSHRVLSESGLCAGTVGGNRHCTDTYIRSLYRSTTAGLSIKQIAVPGLEQSGRPLARFITSGDPLPKLARSGEPLQSLKQSGRPLSR
jgi:hypothetical protein